MLVYVYFNHETFPNMSVSAVSVLHNYNTQSASFNVIFINPHFELILGDFAQALLDVSFGIISGNLTEANHLKNV